MHYYQHHIGDFIRDTSRLTDAQCMTYIRMVWMYYESEQPLPNNPKIIAFKLGADQEIVELILQTYFKQDGEVWRHTRCDSEIEGYHTICNRNKTNGKAGGRPKKTQSVSSGNPSATKAQPNGNPDETLSSIHDPLPNIDTSPNGDGGKPDETGIAQQSADDKKTADQCPHQQIIDLYHRILPMGRTVREWTPARAQSLRARWREQPKRQKLEWWERFFTYVSESKFLTGQSSSQNRRPFEISLDWLVKSENMAKCIEGAYHEASGDAQ